MDPDKYSIKIGQKGRKIDVRMTSARLVVDGVLASPAVSLILISFQEPVLHDTQFSQMGNNQTTQVRMIRETMESFYGVGQNLICQSSY